METIKPHGGVLVDREAKGAERDQIVGRAASLPTITLDERQISDLEMIAIGAFSPLEGFMGRADYDRVVREMRLASGLPWSIPVTLAVTRDVASSLAPGAEVALVDDASHLLAVMRVDEAFEYDKKVEAEQVYRTTDELHPGVAAVYAQGDVLLGGPITLVNHPRNADFPEYRLTPAQVRASFAERGWRTVVAFQTRNPVHRAHEYLQKCAMEVVDGLLLHPIVGATKSDDVSAEVRMECYTAILKNYYPADRTMLAVNPANMRYAGPREAIFHALIRKNYGCTHFIVGRDHAGVGNYYGTFDAHHIFREFAPEELGITPMFFDHAFFCRVCQGMASVKTCPHGKENHVFLSGTKVREMLQNGEMPPPEFSRPEVAKILIDAMRPADTAAPHNA
jgi:sulfate adenylyltransferase